MRHVRTLTAFLIIPQLLLPAHVTRDGNSWTLTSNVTECRFVLTERNTFEMDSIRLPIIGEAWTAGALPSSPVRFAADGVRIDASTPLRLITENVERLDRNNGVRLNLEFDELRGGLRLLVSLELYDDRQVLRSSVRVKNVTGTARVIEMADMLPWALVESGPGPRLMRVNQWSVLPPARNFEVSRTPLENGQPVTLQSGAGQPECTWLATRAENGRGLFAGWEFDGRVRATVRYDSDSRQLNLAAEISDLHHPLNPGDEFQIPPAFLGVYRGDWDEPGFRTQRFVEDVLAKPSPDKTRFPYVVWDSWGYGEDIDERLLRRNAEIAARIGVELFIVDLGWARDIGDWREDPSKFPSGLRNLSDYVHSLGMKFGLHVAPADVAADSEVAALHPDWLATETFEYFGAKPLCLSHKPAQQWIVNQVLGVIDRYGVDWILQDGEHMIKRCTRSGHTHDPLDSNYSNSMDGLNQVLDQVQRARPGVSWENCANGGSMMTFNMVKYYVTSITNDASGALSSRQAAYGATFPFPPRYTDRYMPEQATDAYTTRSYMFGGPWIFMNRLVEAVPEELEWAASEIAAFKTIRGVTRDGKVYHLTGAPADRRTDAIESYSADTDSAVAVVTRENAANSVFPLRLAGLAPGRTYRVHFQDDRRVLHMTGEQLARTGVPVYFDTGRDAEIVYAEPDSMFTSETRTSASRH